MREKALGVANALTFATFKILQLISSKRPDVSTIAEKLKLSEAYVSRQVHTLEDLKLIKVSYERGKRGIHEMCELAAKRMIVVIKPS